MTGCQDALPRYFLGSQRHLSILNPRQLSGIGWALLNPRELLFKGEKHSFLRQANYRGILHCNFCRAAYAILHGSVVPSTPLPAVTAA